MKATDSSSPLKVQMKDLDRDNDDDEDVLTGDQQTKVTEGDKSLEIEKKESNKFALFEMFI